MSILREILHNFLLNVFFIGGGFWIAEECALATGAPPVPGDLAGIAVGAVASVLAYRSVHEPLLRHITGRPHMTPEDYRHLRELETELGWEPSEAPAPEAELPAESPHAACDCGECDDAAREFDEQLREQVIASQGIPPAMAPAAMLALGGAGTLSAPMTGPGGRWRPVSELPEMQQATEGIPAGPLIENMRQELEAQRWLDEERRGGNEH
jgi:hypothetical protein